MAVEAFGSTPRVKVAPWNDPVIRGWVFQVVVVGLVALLAWFLVPNTLENLQRQKIATGFHYLEREAGFEIGDTMIPYSPASTYARAILVGLLNTLKVSVLGIVLATILGTLIGIGRLSHNWLLAKVCEWLCRDVPQRAAAAVAVPVYKLISEAFPGPRQAISTSWSSSSSATAASTSRCRWPIRSTMDGHRPARRHRRRPGRRQRWAKKRQDATGQPFPSSRPASAWCSACPSWSGCWAARRIT